jgi:hypothetical protein
MLEKREKDEFASAETCTYCPWKIFEHMTCVQYSQEEWFIEQRFIEQRIPMLKRWIREYNIHFKKEKQNAENGNVTPSATA